MDKELTALVEGAEQRASKATAGPWTSEAWVRNPSMATVDAAAERCPVASHVYTQDADFIAHARDDVPRLCSKVRELDARVGTLTDLLEQVRDLDSLSDLSDLMPDIIKAVGENPAHYR